MERLNKDTLAGLVLLAFSLVHLFYIIPNQVEMHRSDATLALSPRLFCYITGGLLAGLAAVLILASLRRRGQTDPPEGSPDSWQPLLRGLFSTAMACAYVILAGLLGFSWPRRWP